MSESTLEIFQRIAASAQSFDIKITHFVPRVNGFGEIIENAWVYSARQVVVLKEGRYREFPSSLVWYGLAYNTFESRNSDYGIQGSGDDVDSLPNGLTPIGPGAVIQGAMRRVNSEGVVEVYFSAPNNPDGSCSS